MIKISNGRQHGYVSDEMFDKIQFAQNKGGFIEFNLKTDLHDQSAYLRMFAGELGACKWSWQVFENLDGNNILKEMVQS